jgi:hypothetical protein
MPSLPSIKGSVFATVVESVNKLLAQGNVSREELSRWLKPEDVALLDQEVSVSEWYDIRVAARMSELMRDVEGGGNNDYLRRLGKQSAKRLLEMGLYQQMEYLQNTQVQKAIDAKARSEAFGRDLRLLSTLSASIYNFAKWESIPDPEREGRYLIRISEAKNLPDVLCWRVEGFMNQMAAEHDEPDLWRWDRPKPDLVVFRMNRSV